MMTNSNSKIHGNTGKRHTAEARRKISDFQKSRKREPFSVETRRRMSKAAKNKPQSPKHTRNMAIGVSFAAAWKKAEHLDEIEHLMSLGVENTIAKWDVTPDEILALIAKKKAKS
ncbi:MAG: hypothetical protein J4F41_00150 [Alphaproteobacteria bacterium]|nr:hypothetical protein [Alphaproteobacteria bacterium]